MNSLLVVLPVSQKDYDLALKLIDWMRELGELLSGTCLLVCDEKLTKEQQQKLYWELGYLSEMPDAIVSKHYGPNDAWPIGPNWMWLNTAQHIEANVHRPFFWCEPDCVPLKPGWYESLDMAYARFGKPYMGVILPAAECFGRMWPAHLTGVAVYPSDAASRVASLNLETAQEAWDIISGEIVVPHAHHTRLISHTWGGFRESPTFVEAREKGCPRNHMTLDNISKDAVIFHRVKNDSLRDILRNRGVAKCSV